MDGDIQCVLFGYLIFSLCIISLKFIQFIVPINSVFLFIAD